MVGKIHVESIEHLREFALTLAVSSKKIPESLLPIKQIVSEHLDLIHRRVRELRRRVLELREACSRAESSNGASFGPWYELREAEHALPRTEELFNQFESSLNEYYRNLNHLSLVLESVIPAACQYLTNCVSALEEINRVELPKS